MDNNGEFYVIGIEISLVYEKFEVPTRETANNLI